MGERSRRPVSQAAPEHAPAPRASAEDPQSTLGNAEVASRLTPVDEGGGLLDDDPVGFALPNATGGAGGRPDREQIAGSTAVAGGSRPWNGAEILRNLTQVDTKFETASDGSRCGAMAILAVNIAAGPEAVSRVARTAFSQAPQGTLPAVSSAVQAVRDYPRNATYDQLSALGDLLYYIANPVPSVDKNSRATTSEELDAIDSLGSEEGERSGIAGLADTLRQSARVPEAGSAATEQRAMSDLRSSGDYHGPRELGALVNTLTRHKNVAYVLGIQAPDAAAGDESIGHGVTLGIDGQGQVYFYNPWPIEGKQRLAWPGDRAAITAYFTGHWTIMDRVAASGGASRSAP